MSARYTFLSTSVSVSRLMDQVNNFCNKYPEYRLMQVIHTVTGDWYAILTTDPAEVNRGG